MKAGSIMASSTNSGACGRFATLFTCRIASPRFCLRYGWSEGTVALWDNRFTQHFVVNDFEGERVIQRVTVMGDQPMGVGPPKWPPYRRRGRASDTSRHDDLLKKYLRSQSERGEA